MTQKVRKDGVPVLASSSLDDPAPMLLSLIFVSKSPQKVTLSLRLALHGSGHDDPLNYSLQITPDNLEPGQSYLTAANVPLPQDWLNKLQRQGNPAIRTLCLKFRHRCSVWYPKSITTIPSRGAHGPLDTMVSLATASKLHLILDINWLGKEKGDAFKQFIDDPTSFTACPVKEYYSQNYKHLDWTLFDAPPYRDFETDPEEPTPAYPGTNVKRARRALTPSPRPPSSKRIITSPDVAALHAETIDKDMSRTPHQPEHSSRAANTATLRSSPYSDMPGGDVRLAVEDVLERLLTSKIGNLLPSLIDQLVTAPPPSPSQWSVASERSTTPPPLDLTLFGTALGNYLMERIEAKLDEAYENTLSHADFRRRVADDKFQDQLEEEVLALSRKAESTFHDLEQKCAGLEEDITERVERRLEQILELLDEHPGNVDPEGAGSAYGRVELRRKRAQLNIGEEDIRHERAVLRKEKLDLLLEKAEIRREKAELAKEKLLAQTARDALDQGRDLPFPDLPDCCILP